MAACCASSDEILALPSRTAASAAAAFWSASASSWLICAWLAASWFCCSVCACKIAATCFCWLCSCCWIVWIACIASAILALILSSCACWSKNSEKLSEDANISRGVTVESRYIVLSLAASTFFCWFSFTSFLAIESSSLFLSAWFRLICDCSTLICACKSRTLER